MVSKKNYLKSLVPVLITITFIFCSCDKKEESVNKLERSQNGLIGAYYGDADLTNIKFPEVLPSLSNEWDENTGHGSAWSGKYIGYIQSPVKGELKFQLQTNQVAEFKLADKPALRAEKGESGIIIIEAQEGKKYPVEFTYYHVENILGIVDVYWSWDGADKQPVSNKYLSFDEEQAENWNYKFEPDPSKIDFSEFIQPEREDVVVYYKEGRFAGWPANNGIIWQWGDEIVVGFTLGYYEEKLLHHSINEEKEAYRASARSYDGGEIWEFQGRLKQISKESEIVDYTDPNFAMYVDGNEYWVSYDRAKTWQGPYSLPNFDFERITARTDYIIEGPRQCIYFLSIEDEKVQARLQDRAFCVRTEDGGQTFEFLSWIGEPKTHRAVMPSSVKLSDNHIITSLRRRFDRSFGDTKPKLSSNWIDVYESNDNGLNWQFLSKVAETDMGKNNGNPPSLIKLQDGRLVCTYGYRAVPYGIRAKISEDGGRTWGNEIHLRDHAREFDIGYTRSAQRIDGKIITIYYFRTEKRKEQHIAATIWNPDLYN